MADFAAAQPQPPQLPAGWQPNLQRVISDIVPMLSAEQRQAFRIFMKGLKAKRDAREIPSLSVALMEQAPSVVGADLWQQCIDRQRMGTLLVACWTGHVDTVRLVLNEGAEVDRANQNGVTPLHIACQKGHVAVARLLLDEGAEVDRAAKDGVTPLFIACAEGHVDVVRLLLAKGADVNRAAKDGATPLYAACFKGHVDVAQLLLDKGAEVDRAKEGGWTPLYAACQNSHVDIARLLLDNGAEVDRAKEGGWTPLLVACGKGHVAVARLCLERGAEVDRALEDGKTPLDIAKHHRRDAVVALLEEHLYKSDIDATAPVATQWRGKNLPNMLAGKQRALASKKRALQERDEELEQATKRVARVEEERDEHESRGELLDSMVAPLETQRRELQEIVSAAAKALIYCGVPTRMLPDDDTPFYYARNSWDTMQRVPWNAEAGRPMSLAEGIAWLHDNGS